MSRNQLVAEIEAAAKAFSDIGAKLVSHHLAAWFWVNRACKWWGWDIYSAGGCCLGIGAAIKDRGFTNPNLWPMAPVLRDLLGLPAWPKQTDLERTHSEEAAEAAVTNPIEEVSDFHGQ